MLTLSSQLFPAGEEVTSKECNYIANYRESTANAADTLFHSNPIVNSDNSPPSTTISGDPAAAKKLNHNALERDRRKKINCLYAELRSLLPNTDHTKKLSIPQTVNSVIQYIPELQNQVERLEEKKDELISKLSMNDSSFDQDKKMKRPARSSSPIVLASRVGETEVIVQVSTQKLQKCSLSDILLLVEEEGLMLINATSSESFEGRIFFNLHLQAERNYALDNEALSEKILSLCEKK